MTIEITNPQSAQFNHPDLKSEPVIQLVDQILQNAIEQHASDIHIEPYENNCRIRYRQDGMLSVVTEIPMHLSSRFITRLKVMAKLDISERRLPQDGRFQINKIDVRISTCPTLFGEKVVLRLLDSKKSSLKIDELGLNDHQKNIFLNKISQSQGLILVTGPTGSGKTITLYSALKFLNTAEKNISTVEDPVEIQLPGINQVNINPKIHFDFSTALRTFLRQDPDIIMIGEIRDPKTAEIAIQAAQTGHLVMATLHTNNALEAINRLQSMGVDTYNIINAISLIIAQRLVRKLCLFCKEIDLISQDFMRNHSLSSSCNIFHAVGCQHCHHGYLGRIGIYELLPITDNIAKLIATNTPIHIIMEHAKQEGFTSLYHAGLEKMLNAITSFSEINRVTQQ